MALFTERDTCNINVIPVWFMSFHFDIFLNYEQF